MTQSPQRDRFVLKGTMLFAIYNDEPHRSTGDLPAISEMSLLEFYEGRID
jgi:hypothetical protein